MGEPAHDRQAGKLKRAPDRMLTSDALAQATRRAMKTYPSGRASQWKCALSPRLPASRPSCFVLSFRLACTATPLSAEPTQRCWAMSCRVRPDRDLKTSALAIARPTALGNRLDQEPVARPLNAKVRAGSLQVGTCSARSSWLFAHVSKSGCIVARSRMSINGRSLGMQA